MEKIQVLKISGTPAEILEKLKVLKAIYGGGATLAEIATATQYGRITTATRKQFDGGAKR
jgi:hypothetical protein